MNDRPIDKITQSQINELVTAALKDFYRHDTILLQPVRRPYRLPERAIAFRLGIYIERHFQSFPCADGLSVDMEYNRKFGGPKTIFPSGSRRKNAIPDLIIHKRISTNDDLLVIEFKAGNPPESEIQKDDEKLRYFTDSNGEYRYRFGMYIELHEKDALVKVYRNGVPVETFTFS